MIILRSPSFCTLSCFIYSYRKMKKTNRKQFELLISFIQNHVELATSFAISSEAQTRRQELWKQLTCTLNGHGPPVRTYVGWKNVWADYKYNLKRKLAWDLELRRKNSKKRLSFNKRQRTVMDFLGMNQKIVNFKKYGRSAAKGLQRSLTENSLSSQYNPKANSIEISEVDNSQPSVPSNDIESKRTAPIFDLIDSPSTETFTKTTIGDVNLLAIIQDTLNSVQTTQQAILKELKESNQQKRQTFSVKEQLLALEREKFDEKKLQNYEENKQSYIKIELKRKELELYELKLMGLCTQCSSVKTETDA